MWPWAGLWAFALLWLAPARLTPLTFDDTGAMELRARLEYTGRTFGGFLLDALDDIVVEQGRPQPLGVVSGVVVQYVFSDRLAYKLLLIVLTLACVWAFDLVLRRLGLSAAARGLTLLSAVICIQFEVYHHAVLGYFGVTQISFLFLCAAMLAFLAWQRHGGRRRFALAVAAFVACLAMSETTYALALAFPALALAAGAPLRRALRDGIPFLLAAAAFVCLTILGRSTGTDIASGYAVELNPVAAVETFLIQLVTPLPPSYLLFEPTGWFGDPTRPEIAGAVLRATLALALAWTLTRQARARAALGKARPLALAVLGAVLWAAPVLTVAAAPKYQNELELGMGYLPALLQVFGTGLLAATTVCALARRQSLSPLAACTVSVGVALAAGAAGYANLRVVAIDQATLVQRDLLERSVERGILDPLPQRSTVALHARDITYPRGSFAGGNPTLDAALSERAGKLVDARDDTTVHEFGCTPALPPGDSDENGPALRDCAAWARTAAWLHVRARRSGGTATLALIAPPVAGNEESGPARSLRTYREGAAAAEPPRELTGILPDGAGWSGAEPRWRLVESGRGWAIWAATTAASKAPVAATIDDPHGVVWFVGKPPTSPGTGVRLLGTRRVLP